MNPDVDDATKLFFGFDGATNPDKGLIKACHEILRMRRAIAAIVAMTCDAENQPHQYVGDPSGLFNAAMDKKFTGNEVLEFIYGKVGKQ